MSVRIWNTGGGIRIKDATATPDDVMQGKVFYNNDGKQVGNGIFPFLREKSIVLLPEMAGSGSNIGNRAGARISYNQYGYGDNAFLLKGFETDRYSVKGNKIESDIHIVSGVVVNGIKTDIYWNVDNSNGTETSNGRKLTMRFYSNNPNSDVYAIVHIFDGDIYLEQLDEGNTIEIFYLEKE